MNAGDLATDFGLEDWLADLRAGIERRLAELVPGEPSPAHLADAMRYSLLAPAKRARGLLTVLAAGHCGGAPEAAMPAACAIEMVHAASLILDDLPAMDDAALRRGQASCHRQFGEATASLAAIALMNRAFGVVAASEALPPDCCLAIVRILARAIGTDGLAGGQEGDINGAGLGGTAEVEWVHARKTGALFAAAAEIGAVVAGADRHRAVMHDFGMRLGLAFQSYDDLLDARAARPDIGKDTRSDGGKMTLVGLLGFDAALANADAQWQAAAQCIRHDTGGDGRLARYVASLVAQMLAPLRLTRPT
jgi:geranylgeranyl diphosphate synthase type II